MAWEQLQSILEEEDYEPDPPAACPNDGTPLQDAADGVLHCPYDGWQWPRDRV